MCGIAGVWSSIEDRKKIVSEMCDAMTLRGPDGFGIQELDGLTFGHRRLSIIDLSDRAKQPMFSNCKRYFITFNGEIYNFKELKQELIKKSYVFTSDSDTEVVLNAYIEWGCEIFNKFNGMWALAIYDSIKKVLVLSRDRFGKKPLFYCNLKNHFSFASTVTSLLKDENVPQKKSIEAINSFLSLGYILNPLSLYENVLQLEPAHYLIIKDYGSNVKKIEYWNYANTFRCKTKNSKTDIKYNLQILINEAIRKRMIADVPVGAFLSGGVDSSTIVGKMKQIHSSDLHTFSVGFKSDSYNELPDAEKVSKHFNTLHHEMICDIENTKEYLSNLISAYDQPLADNSLIPMVEVAKLAKKYVTVVLSGDGADELFAGYITYKADYFRKFSKLIPFHIRKFISNISSKSDKKLGAKYKAKQFFYGSLFDYKKAHYCWRLIFRPEEIIDIIGHEHREQILDTNPFKKFDNLYSNVTDLEQLDQHLYVDSQTWLTDDILVKLDRAAMNSSIEGRCPFLDVDLVSYAASLPAHLKLEGLKTKYILKESLKPILPEFVLKKKKSGFNAPVNKWLGQMEGDEFKTFTKFVFENFNKFEK